MFSINDCGLEVSGHMGMGVDEVVSWARYAEKAGYGFVGRSDHLMSTLGENNLESPECWMTLAAMAAGTRSIELGPMVSPVGFRNPALLARMACTLDSYSRGRLRLGVGIGWFRKEYEANGFEYPPFRERARQFGEALKVIRPLTRGKKVDFDGKYFSAHTRCLPKPTKGKVHLTLAGKNPILVKDIAEFADEWNVFGTSPEETRKLCAMLDSQNPSRHIVLSRLGTAVVGENKRELDSRLRRTLKAWKIETKDGIPGVGLGSFLYGLSDDVADQINKLRDAGIERFYFGILDGRDKDMVEGLTNFLRDKF